jgi:hypothetical protein
MGRAFSMNGGDKWMRSFGRKTSREETSWGNPDVADGLRQPITAQEHKIPVPVCCKQTPTTVTCLWNKIPMWETKWTAADWKCAGTEPDVYQRIKRWGISELIISVTISFWRRTLSYERKVRRAIKMLVRTTRLPLPPVFAVLCACEGVGLSWLQPELQITGGAEIMSPSLRLVDRLFIRI